MAQRATAAQRSHAVAAKLRRSRVSTQLGGLETNTSVPHMGGRCKPRVCIPNGGSGLLLLTPTAAQITREGSSIHPATRNQQALCGSCAVSPNQRFSIDIISGFWPRGADRARSCRREIRHPHSNSGAGDSNHSITPRSDWDRSDRHRKNCSIRSSDSAPSIRKSAADRAEVLPRAGTQPNPRTVRANSR